jgi:nicotinamide-nucleotide amidase
MFSLEIQTLARLVIDDARERSLRLVTAESCTGGLLAQRLTAVPNSSSVFIGGAVAYTPELKTTFAGVAKETIDNKGTVSEEVARELAEGIRTRTGASISISITGLAGPAGGVAGPDAEKPVGRIYVGLADDRQTTVKELNLMGDRTRVRFWATQHALELIRRHLL